MDIKEKVLDKMDSMKNFVKDWNVEKILKKLNVNSIEEGLELCRNNIEKYECRMPLQFLSSVVMYYHIKDGKVFVTNSKSKFSFHSKDVFEFEFENEIEELRVLFEITCGLSMVEKFNF